MNLNNQWGRTALKCVFPPVSNQEAVWLQEDVDVETVIRTSNFYAIGGRKEAYFRNIVASSASPIIKFDFVVGDEKLGDVEISIADLPGVSQAQSSYLRAGDKVLQIWDAEAPLDGVESSTFEAGNVLHWWTTEKLLWDLAHGAPWLSGTLVSRLREALTYDLLYVGIAKDQDTFDRLLKKGHKTRQEILSNEPQRHPGARVSDEIYLFFFYADVLVARSIGPDDEVPEDFLSYDIPYKRIIADAEKAFVNLTRPTYNKVQFRNYPKGVDGLYEQGFDSYAYGIAEPVTFSTSEGLLRGDYDIMTEQLGENADVILVKGDEVTVLKSSPA